MNYQNLLVTLKSQATPELVQDIESFIEKLEKEKDNYLRESLNKGHELVELDAKHEELKHNFDNVAATVQNLVKENQALKTIVGLWANE